MNRITMARSTDRVRKLLRDATAKAHECGLKEVTPSLLVWMAYNTNGIAKIVFDGLELQDKVALLTPVQEPFSEANQPVFSQESHRLMELAMEYANQPHPAKLDGVATVNTEAIVYAGLTFSAVAEVMGITPEEFRDKAHFSYDALVMVATIRPLVALPSDNFS